ncbi:hypothetical protein [Sanguibacter inulinus]|uniref:DUF732 domain-containing protein n=1 Tax=Sanguibacter inulinus TaxID=60922 RepID=A0A853ESE6_9MICO|nr:hypothetical protein [Sanguibacter inulinus]MBF0722255.1 hypothetical protein [Sanguibacter inulinus]NYS93400.1 hypothetical protein [Sanguibacter inulinus]
MRATGARAGLVALLIAAAATGCSPTAPKDASPVLTAPSQPSSSAPAETSPPESTPPDDPTTPVPSEEPTFTEPSAEPTVTADPDGSTGQDDFLIPDEEVLFTADELYSSEVQTLYADVEAADRPNRIGICRSAAIVVGKLTSAEIEERREAMAPEDVEVLEDFVSLCQRVLAS